MKGAPGDTSTKSPEQFVEELLPKLRTPKITYFPIRHHSPACAIHIERWILQHRPAVVLVEGPSSFTDRIALLTDPECKCPVALFTNFIDKKDRIEKLIARANSDRLESVKVGESPPSSAEGPENEGAPPSSERTSPSSAPTAPPSEPTSPPSAPTSPPSEPTSPPSTHHDFDAPRFSAYYPFCDYSPELVALRTGRAIGAKLQFIDLEYGEMILGQYRYSPKEPSEEVRVESLTQDAHLKHSQYINALARRMGCRDFDEVWDHLFEACWDNLSTDAFIDRMATYCAMARFDYTQEELTADGTIDREACMAAEICAALENTDGPILVVTGGFHTVALPALVERGTKRPTKLKLDDGESGTWLMRFSFDRLDALSGYSAGMRAPAFYDRLWSEEKSITSGATAGADEASQNRREKFERVAADVLVEISRLTRERNLPNLITTPDSIAAVQMVKQLAALRGHPWPMREDVVDGIRSCFVKGEANVEGLPLMRLVNEVLAGNRIGQIPPGGDTPPIVEDFYREARRFRLNVEHIQKKEYALDLYRNSNHRAISRFFHRMSLLSVPFARYVGGPDFVTGYHLDLLIEHWETQWSPIVESSLIEASVYGNSIQEAASSKLKRQIANLEEDAKGRSTDAAVTLLIRACRLGLHAQSAAMVPLIDIHIAEDPRFASVVSGLSQLGLLEQAREPLEASGLTATPRLMNAAYQRACHLLQDLARSANETVDEAINAMQTLREILANSPCARDSSENDTTASDQQLVPDAIIEVFDRDLFINALSAILDTPPGQAQSAIVGAAAGILYGEGVLNDEELVRIVCGFLGGTGSDPRKSAGILRGLLTTACEIAWQVTEIIAALDEQFQSWDEETFLELLPELRLAFSILTPHDIARVADKVSSLHDGESLGQLVHTDIDDSDVQFALALNDSVRKALEADGLLETKEN